MADVITEVANQLTSPSNNENLPYVQMRFGVVTAINAPDNTCTIQLSGDTSLNISGVKALNTFQPAVSDVVCCLKQGTDVVVIGKFQSSTANSFAQITNIVSANNVIAGPSGFVNLSSVPNSVTITKKYAPSNLFISLSITGWGDVASTGFTAAVNINGTDYVCAAINLDLRTDTGGDTNTMTQRVPCVGSTVVSGLPTGPTTVTIRIKNHGLVGNLHVDTGDFYTLTVQEML
jgi:hypothetical protein